MGVFPQLGNISKNVVETFKQRAGKNVAVSDLMSWVRVSSAGTAGTNGLVLESMPNTNSFTDSYGGDSKSGRVGTNFNGQSVFVDGIDRSHRPSPTIDSISIENGARGLSRKAKFDIKRATIIKKLIFFIANCN